jgi:UDP-N-acetylglucosamine 2-epimerase (non-hydrolysing)
MSILRENGVELPAEFKIVPLMGYLEFLSAQRKSFCIVSDSGTAQEEPAVLGVPVLVPRDFTERWESVEAGNSIMLDLKRPSSQLVESGINFVSSFPTNPDISWMGNGDTAEKIVNILREKL